MEPDRDRPDTLKDRQEAGRRLAALITAREDWAGNFSVIEPGRVRMRPLG